MNNRPHIHKPTTDTSVTSAGKLPQARPFQPDINNNLQAPHIQTELEAQANSWDLTQKQFAFSETPSPLTIGQPLLQAKLTIGEPNDKYEQEADRVAHDVVQRLHSSGGADDESATNPKVGMRTLLTKHIHPLQRQARQEEEELQTKPFSLLQRVRAKDKTASADVEKEISNARGSGQSLTPKLQAQIGQAMGADFSEVRVHTDPRADQLNRSIQARAFTTGQDVFFKQGEYQPGSRSGQELLAHELTHVVQQGGGTVQRSNLPLTRSVADQKINIDVSTQPAIKLKPAVPGIRIQRNWDTTGEEPVYRDVGRGVTWHLCADGDLWYETHEESSPYQGYAGIENKGSYAKWFSLGSAPFELIKAQVSSIEIPHQDELPKEFHEAYRIYVYVMEISTLKWDDVVKKEPFSKLGWKVKKVYEHYRKYVNPLIEKEDTGLNAYYGPFYKRINPFLRAINARFGDDRYDEIIEGKLGGDSAALIEMLDKVSKDAGFNSDIDEVTLKEVLAEIRGAKKEIKKKSEITKISAKFSAVYRGDSARTVDRLASACGFSKDELDQHGSIVVGKDYTQRQFVSTTDQKQIGAPAATGTLWNISLGPKAQATEGGLYTAESEILFPPQTTFHIERIVTIANYDRQGALGDNNTKYVVYARQG